MAVAYVFVTDLRGLELTRHAVAACLATQRPGIDYLIYCDGFEPEPDNVLISSANSKQSDVRYFKLPDSDNLKFNKNSYITRTAMLKLRAVSRSVHEYDRVLYLDGDVLLFQDFGLPEIDFDGYPIAAVYDMGECGGITDGAFFDNCTASGRSVHYFNSGVIAVDCARWRDDYEERFFELGERHMQGCDYKAVCYTADQCAWNMLFERAWKRLPLSYNFQACAMFSERWRHAGVRHYVGPKKYLPYRALRNDARDIALLDDARALLGLGRLPALGGGALRPLAAIRNRPWTRVVCEAIERIERMSAAPL